MLGDGFNKDLRRAYDSLVGNRMQHPVGSWPEVKASWRLKSILNLKLKWIQMKDPKDENHDKNSAFQRF